MIRTADGSQRAVAHFRDTENPCAALLQYFYAERPVVPIYLGLISKSYG
jgi:hypothetical protein